MDKIKPIKYNKSLCFKCLEIKDVNTYKLYERGYGSIYDGTSSTLQLCDDCKPEGVEEWFDENPIRHDYFEEYKYEDNIEEFIKSLPIQGRELFENSCSSGWTSYSIDPQDWIDIELNIADDSTYKKYNFYSPSEIKAYHDRFPTCKHTYLKIYQDGSKGTYCRRGGASGKDDGSCSINISSDCYYCKNYDKKDDYTQIEVEKTITVEPKEVTMLEVFCPICGHKNHYYKNEIVYDCREYIRCDKCWQEMFIDLDKYIED